MLMLAYWPADRSFPVLDITVGDMLREAAAAAPGATALVAGNPGPSDRRRWTYTELLEQSEQAARALLGRFEPGERVAVWANNSPEWVMLEFAAALAGITIVTVNPALRAQELAHVLGQSKANGVFLIPEYRGTRLDRLLDEVRDGLPALREVVSFTDWADFTVSGSPARTLPAVNTLDPAQVQYTSGTTGVPKGAVLHHRGIVNNARLTMERGGLPPGTVFLSPMPLFHAAGCVMCVLGAVDTRGTLVLPPAFDPGLMLELIESERVECVIAVPTMHIGVLDHPGLAATDVSSVRLLFTGGAVVPPALVKRVEAAFGAPMCIVFAQTEASPVITETAPGDATADREETLGRPLPDTEVKIIDAATGDTVAPGVIGELCTRGYHVMTGYLDDPEATAAAIDADGWLHTGDLGSMDERGYCRIGGRLKDMIIRGGENIYPREIEEVLYTHAGVLECAVIGVPHEVRGEEVLAVVAPKPGAQLDGDDLQAYAAERLAAFKVPRRFEIRPELPKNATGKISKPPLREEFGHWAEAKR